MNARPSAFLEGSQARKSRPVRYERLPPAERAGAESLARNCHVHEGNEAAAGRLADRWFRQSVGVAIPLILVDFAALWFVLLASTAVSERLFAVPHDLVTRYTALLASVLLVPIAELAGVYPGLGLSPIVEFRQLVRSAVVALAVFAGIGVVLLPEYGYFYLCSSVAAFLLAIPSMPAARFAARSLLAKLPRWGVPVFIYADPAGAAELFRRLQRMPDRGFRPAGVILAPEDYWLSGAELSDQGIPAYDVRNVAECALGVGATWLLVGPAEGTDKSGVAEPVRQLLRAIPNQVILSSSKLDVGLWDHTYSIGAACGVRIGARRQSAFKAALKRGFDLAVTATALASLLPLLAAIAVSIRLNSPGPVFYGQWRIGRGGRQFKAWKFRTMRPDAERLLHEHLASDPASWHEWQSTHKLRRDPRVTSVGRLLRSTSLDELPQLWNVIVGDMSLVGPRPIVDSPTYDAIYVRDYANEFAAYQSVRPGLTGLWQVTCRNSGVYEMRIYWDMYYIRNWSPWLDLYILLRTVRTVLLREGAY